MNKVVKGIATCLSVALTLSASVKCKTLIYIKFILLEWDSDWKLKYFHFNRALFNILHV